MIADNIWHYFPPNCCLQLSVYICEKPASLAYQDRKQSSYLVLIPYVCNSCNCKDTEILHRCLMIWVCLCLLACVLWQLQHIECIA